MIPTSTSFRETTGLTQAAQRQIAGLLCALWSGSVVVRRQPLKKVFCQSTHRHLRLVCAQCAESMLLPADSVGNKCKMTPKCKGAYQREIVALEKSA